MKMFYLIKLNEQKIIFENNFYIFSVFILFILQQIEIIEQ